MASRKIGAVTGVTAVGGSLGAAIAQVVVHFALALADVEAAVTVILTAVLALVAGYLVPPQQEEEIGVEIDLDDLYNEDEGELPDLEGEPLEEEEV